MPEGGGRDSPGYKCGRVDGDLRRIVEAMLWRRRWSSARGPLSRSTPPSSTCPKGASMAHQVADWPIVRDQAQAFRLTTMC
eukprot:8841373-Alexandrium_andersonii.AAC.1